MKFWQQFEIYNLYVCAKFQGNESRDFGFSARKPPQKFGVESSLIQKRLKYGKKFFTSMVICRKIRYPFIPTYTLDFGPRWVFFFLFFAF